MINRSNGSSQCQEYRDIINSFNNNNPENIYKSSNFYHTRCVTTGWLINKFVTNFSIFL